MPAESMSRKQFIVFASSVVWSWLFMKLWFLDNFLWCGVVGIESAWITETLSKGNEDEQFLRFIKFDKDERRYEVDLLWREESCKQSDNFYLCHEI